MPTHLPNPFLNSLTPPPSPPVRDTAGVSPPPDAPAGTISNPALELETTAGSAVANPCVERSAAAVLIDEPSSNEGRLQEALAVSRIVTVAAGAAGALEAPWESRFWLVLDEVLTFPPIDLDPSPLFLRDVEHLRRWA